MKHTAKTASDSFAEAYTSALRYLASMMEEAGVRFLDLVYPGRTGAYNVCITEGSSDRIVRLESSEEDGLTAIGESGQIYPLGDDYEGQDNYDIAFLPLLVHAAWDALQKVEERCVKLTSTAQAAMYADITQYLRRRGPVRFEGGYPLPSFRDRSMTAVSEETVFTLDPVREIRMNHPLDTLNTRELRELARSINAYVKYRHNEGLD
jgi:hypothetical protein